MLLKNCTLKTFSKIGFPYWMKFRIYFCNGIFGSSCGLFIVLLDLVIPFVDVSIGYLLGQFIISQLLKEWI